MFDKALVLKTGLEPVRPNGHWILSPIIFNSNNIKLTHIQLINSNLIFYDII